MLNLERAVLRSPFSLLHIRRNFVISALFAVLFVAAATGAFAQEYNGESDFKVKKEGAGITITKYSGKATVVNIPPSIQNLPVTSIGYRAFFMSKVTSVTIPASVTSIDRGTFQQCNNLTSVTFEGTIRNIHLTAFGVSTDLMYGGYIGNLRDMHLAGGAGTYTRSPGNTRSGGDTWTKYVSPAEAAAIAEAKAEQQAAADKARAANQAAAQKALDDEKKAFLAKAKAANPAAGIDARLEGRWRAMSSNGMVGSLGLSGNYRHNRDMYEFRFTNGTYTIRKVTGRDDDKFPPQHAVEFTEQGIYVTNESKGEITLKVTHVYDIGLSYAIHDREDWLSREDMIAFYKSEGRTDAQINDRLARAFTERTLRYELNRGEELYIYEGGNTYRFYK